MPKHRVSADELLDDPLAIELPEGEGEDAELIVERPRRVQEFGSRSVEARVVYLGQNPHMSVYYPGSIVVQENDDGTLTYEPNAEGATAYDFSRYDTRHRVIRERLTKDGRMWHFCRHIGHLVRFLNELDGDRQPLFELRALPAVKARVEEYARLLAEAERRPGDRGRPVLEAMGLV